jgi:CDGSH-type Zn-finger protein
MALPENALKIVIIKNGPYLVHGKIPLVHKTQVVSELGEPLTWKKEKEYTTSQEGYALCRCGQSANKPFCDGTHRKVNFDGTECADTAPIVERQTAMKSGSRLIVKKDYSLCMNSGYCGLVDNTLEDYVADSDNTESRLIAISMVERCPAGALTYQIEEDQPDIEPDLPVQIAATTEITSDGPIAGSLWVTGYIPIERSDHEPVETRNRVTLCNCGMSNNKPFCDGVHRREAAKRAKKQRE